MMVLIAYIGEDHWRYRITENRKYKKLSPISSTCKQIFPDISNVHFPPLSVKTNNLEIF